MRRIVLPVIALLVFGTVQPGSAQRAASDLRLILVVAVDQFRYDFLTRFEDEYTGGLRRLMTEGAVFSNANLEHYPTVTAVGHATMLSGAFPADSGIIGNDWYDRESGARVTSVSDGGVQLLGGPTGTGSSPHRLLVTTVGDELKVASLTRSQTPSRVIGVSLKDRAAVLMAGRGADAAYWFDQRTGAFVTSTYYGRTAAPWLAAFNGPKPANRYAGQVWNVLGSPFAALPSEPGSDLYKAIYSTPAGNELLLEFTEEVLRQEQLGQRNATDLLAVGISANDTVGHTYGPNSPQVHDVTLRTDQLLDHLLDRVEETVGLDRTLVVLTSDHGVAPLPEMLAERRLPGGRLATRDLIDPILEALTKAYGAGDWILATAGTSPYLNYELIADKKLDSVEVRRVAAEAAWTSPHVVRVYTRDQLQRGDVPSDRLGLRIARSFNWQRSGDLEVLLEPNWIRQAEGTTHGTPYNYDAHIPLVLMGPGVRPGWYATEVALNDLAPTLSTIAGVETPSGSAGRVLVEALTTVPMSRPVSP